MHDWYEISTENGRTELANTTRTMQYAKALGINGIEDCWCPCANLFACDPGPYICENEDAACDFSIIDSNESPGAPWWCPEHPASYDYAGMIITDVDGWNSGYTRNVTENVLDGSSFGIRRRSGRCLTFSAILFSVSECGLEYAVSYYDSLFDNLTSCGLFTLYSASCCPGDVEEECLPDYVRHVREATLSAGIKVDNTFVSHCGRTSPQCGCAKCCGGEYYAEVQFTICSEQPWVYTEPDFCLQDGLLLPPDIACTSSVDWIPVEEQGTDATKLLTRFVPTQREKFGVRLLPDGTLCRLGDWEWSETQIGGGEGIVVISEVIEEEEVEEVEEELKPLYIDFLYSESQDLYEFKTSRWSNQTFDDPESLPCNVEIGCFYIDNPEYAAYQQQIDDTAAGDPGTVYSPPPGGTDEDSISDDGSWTGPNGQTGCTPGAVCDTRARDAAALTDFPPRYVQADLGSGEECCLLELNWQNFRSGSWRPGSDDEHDDWSVNDLPFKTEGWGVADAGVFPPCGCKLLIAKPDSCTVEEVEEEEEDPCREFGECKTFLYFNDTWAFLDEDGIPFRPDKFPDELCEYVVGQNQLEDEYLVEEQYDPEDETRIKFFPSFESDCYEDIFIPRSDFTNDAESCFCLTLSTVKQCCIYKNPSCSYGAVGSVNIRAGNEDLKNMRMRAWIEPDDTLPSPCEDLDAWCDREPDFSVDIPHIPAGSTLSVDSEARDATLTFPGGKTEPAVRYISGFEGRLFDYLEAGPCDTIYFLLEADCCNTAENARADIFFSNRYGASGSL